MARLVIVALGRLREAALKALVEEYLKRARPLLRQLGFTALDQHELLESRKKTASERKKQEAEAIRKALPRGARLMLLDERGEMPDTRQFQQLLRKLASQGDVAIVIGGPDGLDASLRAQADAVIAFGPMTWPHQLVRAMLAEQLYRAATIAAGHPYHRE